MRAKATELAATGAVIAALAVPVVPAMARAHRSAAARTLKQVAALKKTNAALVSELVALETKAAELEAREPAVPLPGGPAAGDLAGTYPNPTVKAGAVSSEDLLDGTLQGEDFAPGSLTPADFAPGALGSLAIADGGIGPAQLAGDSVGGLPLGEIQVIRTPKVPLAPGKKSAATAECLPGEVLISGSSEWQSVPMGPFEPGVSFPGLTTTNSEPSPLGNAWITDGMNGAEVAVSLNAIALCLK